MSKNQQSGQSSGGHSASKSTTIKGTRGNDVLAGTEGKNKILGRAGDDTLLGGGGDDRLHGGRGNDTLDGGEGNDRLKGNPGNDLLAGGSGTDWLKGGAGNDTLDGGAGADRVDGDSGNDVLVYRASENAGARDRYDGGSGCDTLRLVLTGEEWLRADVQGDVKRFLEYLDAHHRGSGHGHHGDGPGHGDGDSHGPHQWFEFRAFDLEVRRVEKLEVQVNGVLLDPRDEAVDALDDAAGSTEDGSVAGNVLANDSVPDLVKTVELVSGPAQGTLALNADGSYTYAPGADFNSLAAGETATQTFAYRVTDADGDSDTATATITITGSNDAATVSSDSRALDEGDDAAAISASGALLVTDPDNGEAHTVAQSVATAFGSFAVDADGNWSYTANGAHDELGAGQQVIETFSVASQDGTASGTVSIAITGTNDAPVISSEPSEAAGAVREDTALVASGQLAATDVDQGATQSWSVVGPATGNYGAIAVDGHSGGWTYTLTNGTDGAAGPVQSLADGEQQQETFAIRVTDDQGATADQLVTVAVSGANDAPTAEDDSVVIGSSSAPASLTFDNGYGVISYTDPFGNLRDAVTSDDFRYTASYATSANDTNPGGPGVSSYFTGTGSNALVSTGGYQDLGGYRPVTAAPIEMTRADGSAFSISSANLTSFSWFGEFYGGYVTNHETVTGYLNGAQVAQQSFVFSNSPANVLDLTDAGFATVDRVEFSLSSSYVNNLNYYYFLNYAGAVQSIDNIITSSTSAAAQPVADIDVLANDSDIDHGSVLAVAAFDGSSALGGTLSLNGDGTLHYDATGAAGYRALAAGETATDTFAYTSGDEHGAASNSATVSVRVTGVNDAATVGSESRALNEGNDAAALSTSGALSVTDPDHGEAHTVAQSVTTAYGSFAVDADGNWSYTANGAHDELYAGQQVIETFSVASQDATASGTVSISISGTNDAPVITSNAQAASGAVQAEHTSTTFSGTMTADNEFKIYVSSDDYQLGTYLGSGNNWGLPFGFNAASLTQGSTNYIHVAATNWGGPGGILGSFYLSDSNFAFTNGSTVENTTAADWKVSLTGFGSNYQTPVNEGANGVSPWGTLSGISASSNWMWSYDSHNGSDTHTEYFSMKISPILPSATGQLTASDADIGATQSWSVAAGGAGIYGSLAVDANTGSWTYSLNNNTSAVQALAQGQSAYDNFTVSVADEHGASADQLVSVTVTGINDAPLAANDTVATNEDTAVSIAVLGNDTDPDVGDTKTLLSVSGPQHGTALVSGSNVLYAPAANYHGSDSFTYTMKDAAGATGTATVNVTVNPVSDSYSLSNLVSNGSFEPNTAGWTVTGAGVDVVSSSGWQPGDGTYSVDLNAFHPGGVQQVLQTTPGVQYAVGFELSKNPGNSTYATVQVSADTATPTSQSFSFGAANSATNMMWSQQTFAFVATGSTTTLSFASTYPNDGVPSQPWQFYAQGPALDEVVVVSNKTIDNFAKGAGGDVLQLHDLLTSVGAPHDGTAFSGGFLGFLQSGGDTLVQVDANGGANSFLTVATLTNQLLAQTDTANYVL